MNTIGINSIGKYNGLMAVIIGIISYFSFNLLKSFVSLVSFYFGNDISIGYVDAPVDPSFFVFVVMMLGVWMPIGEEMIYRGMLFHMISRPKRAGILILFNCVVFSGAHQSAEQMIQAFFLGVVLCLLVRRMNGITMGLIVHVSFNVLGLVMTYFCPLFVFKAFGVEEQMSSNQLLLSASCMLFFSIFFMTLLILLISRLKPFDQVPDNDGSQIVNKSYQIPAILMIIVVGSYSILKIVRTFGHFI